MTDGYPIVDLDSDVDEVDSSSEDDLDVILHGTPDQKRRLRRRSLGRKSSSSEDEFEKEMTAELDATMKSIETHRTKSTSCQGGSHQTTSQPVIEKEFYDEDYFDSDSDEECSSKDKKKKKHPVLTNDELLYDPHMDDEDQLWVNQRRRQYQPKQSSQRGVPKQDQRVQRLPRSDAVLNCPACMTLLCLDCQRHDIYKTQFRAMFVQNCQIDPTETLNFPTQAPKGKKTKKNKSNKRAKSQSGEEAGVTGTPDVTTGDKYHPVRCQQCTTQVGVYDQDEIYHFFNILASYG